MAVALGTFLTAVRDGLAARPGLSSVTVRLVAGDESTKDSIVLMAPAVAPPSANADYDRDWGGDPLLLDVTVDGHVRVYRQDRDGDVAVDAALDAADAIMDEIHTYLATSRPTLGTQTTDARVATWDYDLAVSDARGWVLTVNFQMLFACLDDPTD